MNPTFLLLTVLIGGALAAQPAINQAAIRVLGSPASAAVVSVSITLVMMIGLMFATGGRIEPGALVRLPWWILLGGFVGFLFVFGGVTLAPALGAAAFFVCIVAGQLAGAAIIDQIGAFGMPVKPISLMRLAGMGLVLAGVVLVVFGSIER